MWAFNAAQWEVSQTVGPISTTARMVRFSVSMWFVQLMSQSNVKKKRGPKPKEINWEEVKRLRGLYWRVGKLADHFGVSVAGMSTGMKKRNIK